MSEYLDPVDPGDRRFAAVVFLVALILFVSCECVLALILLSDPAPSVAPPNKPALLLLFLFLTALIAACSWMLVRINNGTKSSNGITMMPPWFIRCFGCFFLAVAVLAMIQLSVFEAFIALMLALPMLFVGRLIKAEQEKTPDVSAK